MFERFPCYRNGVGENFPYGFKGAQSGPTQSWPRTSEAPRDAALARARRKSRPAVNPGTVARRAPPAALSLDPPREFG
jgi:hypothetical protein